MDKSREDVNTMIEQNKSVYEAIQNALIRIGGPPLHEIEKLEYSTLVAMQQVIATLYVARELSLIRGILETAQAGPQP